MRKTTIFKALSLLLVAMLAMAGMVFAESTTPTAELEFFISETDGLVTVDMTVKNTTFMGFQFAMRYNKEVISPVDGEGNEAETYGAFAKRAEEAKFFNELGPLLDKEHGVFGSTLFIMPGTEAEGINDSSEYVAGEDGIKTYTFTFKRLADGEMGIEIAAKEESKPNQLGLDEGIIIMDYATGKLEAKVSYIKDGEEPKTVTITPIEEVADNSIPVFTSSKRKEDVICMKIGENMTFTYGKKQVIDEDSRVVPYIVNDRTLVPLRYISETLGAEVLWEDGWDGCIIKKDDTEIKITFGSAEFTVNGEKIVYEAPIETVYDRTMVPVRFVSEVLKCDVYWNELNQAVVISPMDNPWVEKRTVEVQALNEMLISLLGIL